MPKDKVELDKFDALLAESNKAIVSSISNEDEKLRGIVDSFLNRKTCNCPFCGNQPARDLSKIGTSAVEGKALRDAPEYNQDDQYKRAVEDLIAKDPIKISYRIMCRSEDCLFPNTGFLDDVEETFKKWEQRIEVYR